MEITTLSQLIATLGFPIVTTGALFWYMVTEERELRNVIKNNTDVLIKILEHIKDLDYNGGDL